MPHFTSSDGLQIYYTDEGTGLPILCLAGLTRTTADFEYVSPHLSDTRLIKMDYRGRGQSDFDSNPANYVLPVECRDVLELLAHLKLEKVAILGTSRGGLNAMALAAMAKDRLLGVALNDIGPHVDMAGVAFILQYIGKNPVAKTHAEAAAAMAAVFTEFEDVPQSRWLREAEKNFRATDVGLEITYDPRLRDGVEAASRMPPPDLWPLFAALDGLPLACLRGAASNLLSAETLAEMQAKRPDMITGVVPGRGHVPFLDEPIAVETLRKWIEAMS